MDQQQPGPSKSPGKSDNQPEKSKPGKDEDKAVRWNIPGSFQKRVILTPPETTTKIAKVSASIGKQTKHTSRSERIIILTPPESKHQKPNRTETRIVLTPPESKTQPEVKRVILTPPDNPRYTTVVLTPEQEKQKFTTVVLSPSRSHGITEKPSEGKVDDNTIVQKIISLLSQGNSRETYLNQLKAFGIPDQKRLLRFLLDKDTQIFDFGGLMRKYYSFILRNYALINMQDNYREPYNFLTCFAGLDVSKIGSKEEEQEKEMDKKLKQREEKQEDLRYVSIDEEHFLFLKQLANEQPTTIPLTVLKGLVHQAMPVLMDTYRTYARTFGNTHECTKVACEQYVRMKTRINLYNKMEYLPSSQR